MLDQHILEQMVCEGCSIRQIGEALGSSYTNTRYWLNVFELQTNRSSSRKDDPQRACTKCGRQYHYTPSNTAGHQPTLCNSCDVYRRRTEMKQEAIRYKGGRCVLCGYDKCARSLVFHHRDPSKKGFCINSKYIRLSWGNLRGELDKCDLLCANCHGEVHADGAIVQREDAASARRK